ncbi:MAG: hypothetical protein HY077_14570 [Elusimicrobia bacterium]|nr:hypothetical protein [Elusimicrobiota bacterium]
MKVRLLRPSEALVLVLGLPSWSAAEAVPCPEAYQKTYEAELGLAAQSWNDQCEAGLTPDQILERARRPRPAATVPARKAPKNELSTQLGRTLQTSDFGRLYDGGSSGLGVSAPEGTSRQPSGKAPQFTPAVPSGPRPLPPSLGPYQQYHGPDTDKPGFLRKAWYIFQDIRHFYGYEMTAQEKKRLDEVKALLSSTSSGQQLIADLGGWTEIDMLVEIKFAERANPREQGATFPLLHAQASKDSRKIGLALSQNLLKEPPEIVATILAHELSHARDFKAHGFEFGLALPSEYQAHRTEVYVYEELLAKAAPERRRELEKTKLGQYTKFVAALWEDQLLKKYPTVDGFLAQFPKGGNLPGMAYQAYADMVHRTIAPGSPQLDYHVYDLYKTATDETDAKESKASPELLAKRQKLVDAMNARDEAFRKGRGFEIPAGVR